MAVPKKKISPSRRGQKRANKKLKSLNISFNSVTGEPHLSHRMSEDGSYNGKNYLKSD